MMMMNIHVIEECSNNNLLIVQCDIVYDVLPKYPLPVDNELEQADPIVLT